MSPLICRSELRRETVRQHEKLCGLDFLEVDTDPRILTVYFLGKAPELWWKKDKHGNPVLAPQDLLPYFRIEGGQRITDIKVVSVLEFQHYEMGELDDYIKILLDRAGDFSTYTLRVVKKNQKGQWVRHKDFDPHYDRVEFSFKADCPSDLDCKQEVVCPPEKLEEPEINYLAKDYASFRQLILDRLALVMPDWRERHVPDLGITLVELLAYVGDHLSYYQDAVATEAYLDTARQRISVRRHVRLVDYNMHEGCNARTWVCVETTGNLTLNPRDIYFITAIDRIASVVKEDELLRDTTQGYEVFEPITEKATTLYPGRHEIDFYTWGDEECCLPRGATTATLKGDWVQEPTTHKPHQCEPGHDTTKGAKPEAASPSHKPHLKPGDVLIFEEVIGPKTGNPADADPKRRHAVRLTDVRHGRDPLSSDAITEITWAEEDALPFPLCLSAMGPPPGCTVIKNISVARGNIILVDHGRKVEEDLGEVPTKETIEECDCLGGVKEKVVIPDRYEPPLKKAPLTFSQPIRADVPATRMLIQNVRQALPQIRLKGIPAVADGTKALFSWDDLKDPSDLVRRLKSPSDDISRILLSKLSDETRKVLDEYARSKAISLEDLQRSLRDDLKKLVECWKPVRDLLGSHGQDRHFVAEMDNDGHARLRFGNDELGQQPNAGTKFHAVYRVGSGPAGNVGADTISHLVTRNTSLSGASITIRNPFPASGGTSPEPLAEVKLFAPHAFRKRLERAITPADYVAIVQREFPHKVQRAAAQLRWNGSWYEMLVAVDPLGREEASAALLKEIKGRLYRYRRIGHDLVVQAAHRVPLDIELLICVLPGYLRGHVKAALLDVFSNRMLPDGRLGFFHPDNLTFGEGIYLSKLAAAAQAVSGVESIKVNKLERQSEGPNGEIGNGTLPLGPLEIARMDNDPSFPENGLLTLDVRGGR